MKRTRGRLALSFQNRYARVLRTAASAPLHSRLRTQSLMHGGQKSRKEGGRESPVGRRVWEPGEPIRAIDWSASEINPEGILERRVDLKLRRTPTAVLVDASPSMLFGGGRGLTKIEHAAALAVSIIRSAVAKGDTVQVSIFDRARLVRSIPPNHVDHLVKQTVTTLLRHADRLAQEEKARALEQRPHRIVGRWLARLFNGRTPTEPTGESGLRQALRKLSFSIPGQIFLISDCVWLGEDDRNAIRLAAGTNEARCLLVIDPGEAELPKGWHWHRFAELGTGAISSFFVTPGVRRRHRAFVEEQLLATVTLLRRLNCRTVVSSTGQDRAGVFKTLTKLTDG